MSKCYFKVLLSATSEMKGNMSFSEFNILLLDKVNEYIGQRVSQLTLTLPATVLILKPLRIPKQTFSFIVLDFEDNTASSWTNLGICCLRKSAYAQCIRQCRKGENKGHC